MIVLVDTGAFYALADDSDGNAEEARAFFRARLKTDRFVTTDAILLEAWTLIRGRLGWSAAHRFLDAQRRSNVALFYIEAADLELAWRVLNDYADQELSLTDAISFAVMERHGIGDAFSFDKDFLLYRYGPRKQRSFTRWPS